ncbi:MAG TPA: 4Fe-4S dicluster domain-containing protein [Gemmataceae bacterium]|nr:4Fe-4S dicluster domain-containing protein [Gemmataceae bacterium]
MSEPQARRYLKSLPLRDANGSSELPADAEYGPDRRSFLKAAGFTFAGAFLAGCHRAPTEEAIAPLVQSGQTVPGTASYYASTCGACTAGCGLLAKTRDGRPIKLEGNPDHPLSAGGLCAAGQASLLGLYDSLRLQYPLHQGREVPWDEVDRGIRGQLDSIRRQGGAVRVLSGTITSPTTREFLQRFLSGFNDARHVTYDPVSCSAVLDAHERTHGVRVLPHYRFAGAEVIASFDADFLGTWISPVEYARGYREGRQLTGNPLHSSYHVQLESRLSLSGSKADQRVCLAPDEMRAALAHLAGRLARQAGVLDAGDPRSAANGLPAGVVSFCDVLAKQLWQARGHSLVLCGLQDVPSQVLCNFINHLLDNYGATLDVERPSLQRQGNDRDLEVLIGELNARKVAALFILDSNPVYDLPEGEKLAKSLGQVPLFVCSNERPDETARLAQFVCPHPHYLESWSDAEPVSGIVGLRQPTIPRLGDTRSVLESLAAWTGNAKPAYDLLRANWQAQVFPRQSKERNFDAFWDQAVHNGYAQVIPAKLSAKPFDLAAVRPALQAAGGTDSGTILVLYPKVGIPDGSHAYNPWLQELPDPISKVTWDNYACLSPEAATKMGVAEGDVVSLEVPNREGKTGLVELPVFIQPGQHDRVVAVALGYGSIASKRFAQVGPEWLEAKPTLGENGLVGSNAAPLLAWKGGTLQYARADVKLTKTNAKHTLASTQTHNAITVPRHLAPPGLERRPIIEETTLAALAGHAAGDPAHAEKQPDLWPADHAYTGHRWGMVIDLNACTGCSACVIACQAENNVPVVGKDEVTRQREMHWLRIDRYYSGIGAEMQVAHQPMLCQHCEHAPCETVCPVLATVHSDEGLNEQVYNRCVGTRYCANNCPYKVRRFNWFAYAHNDQLQNLSLNPDVTVRSRGVMEKCTFCVQRVQEAKIEAKQRGEPVHDGDFQTACQQSCPAQAIVFGDMNDPTSHVARQRKDARHYQVLAELNIGPSVGYLKVVRNRAESQKEQQHG